VLLVLRVHKEL
jgi:hypothetical protein